MKQIKVRMEAQLDAGDLVTPMQALAAAMASFTAQLGSSAARALPTGAGIIDVPRGKLVYLVEVNGKVDDPGAPAE